MVLVTLAPLLAAVALAALGQVLFKLGVRGGAPPAALLSPYVLVGLAVYALSTLLWLRALARLPLSFAYPFASLTFLLVTLAGHFLFREPLSPTQVAGCLLIAAGLACLARQPSL